MSSLNVNSKDFESEVLNQTKPVLVDFYADWCGPCMMMSPTIEKIATEHPEIIVKKVDVDSCPDLAYKYNINSIPTLIVFKNGKITNQSLGLKDEESILYLIK